VTSTVEANGGKFVARGGRLEVILGDWTPKRLAFDEFHRTGGAPAVRAQVERDAREARKHGIRLCLASQRHEDFGAALVELANRIWVLGAGGKAGELETLSSLFELSGTVADAVTRAFTARLEERVRQYPEQYLWHHRRWKTQPPGDDDGERRENRVCID